VLSVQSVDSTVSLFSLSHRAAVSQALTVTWQLKLNYVMNCFVHSSLQVLSVEMRDYKLQGLIGKLLGLSVLAKCLV